MFSYHFWSDVGSYCNTGFDCNASYISSYSWSNAVVEGGRNDVFCVQFFVRYQTCDCMSSSQFHFFVDLSCVNIQSATEDTRECQNIVDLVWIVGTTGTHDCYASFFSQFRFDFWIWVSHSEYDWVWFHGFNHFWGQNISNRAAQEQVSVFYNISQTAFDHVRVGDLSDSSGGASHIWTAFVYSTLGVAQSDVFYAQSHDQFGNGDCSSAAAVYSNFQVFCFFALQFQSVDGSSSTYDSGTVLVIVEYWDIADLFEFFFNVEAVRSADIFQVYAAEGWFHQFNGSDDFFRIFGVEADWESVNASEGFEQNAFTFHYWQTSACTDIAQTQYSGTVGNNCNQVAFCGVVVDFVIVMVDFHAWFCYTWGVSQRQVLFGVYWYFAFDGDFALCLFVEFQSLFFQSHANTASLFFVQHRIIRS